MARRHGWQLPAHTFQVVAITVYLLLSIAFYAFFAPFLGKDGYEYVAVAVYTFLVMSVFVLYVRCTAIDPADPGILVPSSGKGGGCVEEGGDLKDGCGLGRKSSGLVKEPSEVGGILILFFCACIVKEDCRGDYVIDQQQSSSEDALFCTLCNAEVRRFSKHCRSCDKCVDGFDHHCRWLNNCVGRKNYISFLFLMLFSFIWLLVQSVIGIAVLVQCFTHKTDTDIQIVERLGNGFSRAPFAAVVAFCTTVCLLATMPLGELFCFHMLLIRKGITTYEYVVAMRAQSEEAQVQSANGEGDVENPTIQSSPISSSVTAASGGSSLGLSYRGAWCTPPRIFVDPHPEPGRLPSKRPVRISAWKLAKLDSAEAVKAASIARASSSVIRPVNSRLQYYDTDQSSSGNVSSRSSTAISVDAVGFRRSSGLMNSKKKYLSSYPPSQASREHDGNYETSASGGDECQPEQATTRLKSTVFWDEQAGRFVSSQSQSGTGSSRIGRMELMYSGQSIFFASPLSNNGMIAPSSSLWQSGGDRRSGRQELPVFAPSASQDDFSRNL